MVSHALMALVDTFCVARLGASALAGVGLGSVAFFTFAAFGFGFFRGSKTLISNAHGAEDPEQVRRHRGAGVLAAFGVGAAVSLGLYVTSLFLPLATASTGAGLAARSYASIVSFAGVPAMLYVSLREARYGVGDAKTPMVAALVANATNIVLDVVLVWHLDYGVAGAAIATVASYGVQLVFLAPRRGSLARPRREDLHALRRIGAPTGIQFLLEIGSFALLAAVISSMEEEQMAAHQVALQLMHFVFLPMNALSESCAVLAGQADGAGRRSLVSHVARLGRRVAIVYAIAWFAVLLYSRKHFALAFTDDPALAANIATLLLAGALFQFADGMAMLAAAILRGLGDVKYAAVVGVTASWALTPPLTYLLGVELGLGALGGWIGLSGQFALQAVLLWRRLGNRLRLPASRRCAPP